MTTKEMLEKITAARELLSDRWIAYRLTNGRGGYCQSGCLMVACGVRENASGFELPYGRPGSEFVILREFINDIAGEIFPWLRGPIAAIYVNNKLGRTAILSVYDEAIRRLEGKLLTEELGAMPAEKPEEQMEEVLAG